MKVTPINEELINEVSEKAKASERLRVPHCFHKDHEEPVQRMLNAVEPNSYIRPHRHIDPARDEVFMVLQGKGAGVIFDDMGEIISIIPLDPEKKQWGLDIPGGVYHTLISLEDGSVFYEVKPGPYQPINDKGFAPWSPEEGTPEAAEYLTSLKEKVEAFIQR